MPEQSRTTSSAYRASVCKGFVRYLETMAPERQAAIYQRTGVEPIDRIAAAHVMAWVPATALDSLTTAVCDIAGREEYVNIWRDFTGRAVDVPLFKPLVRTMYAIGGRDISVWLRRIPAAWPMVTRNYGRVVLDPASTAEHVALELVDLPEHVRLPSAALGLTAGVLGVCDMLACNGKVDTDLSTLPHGRVSYRLSVPAAKAA